MTNAFRATWADIDPESTYQILWGGFTFQIHRLRDEKWVLRWGRKTDLVHYASGQDAAVILADAISAAGLSETVRQKIFSELMRGLRERMFN